jgi:dCTP deaminase
LILTDREISILLDRRLITIDPHPEEIAFTSSAVDLTLNPLIWIVRDSAPTPENVIDPRVARFNAEQVMRDLSAEETISTKTGFLLPPRKLALAWTREYIELKTETRLAARVEGKALWRASGWSFT